MGRKCFYSFHYKPDNWRASTVRRIGSIDGSRTVSDNDWEAITNGGDPAIKKWISDEMHGKSCTIVLIGASTAGRKWINYEIEKTWVDGKGIVGIYIHNILDKTSQSCSKGPNPFDSFKIGETRLSSIVKAYDPPYSDSKKCYEYIAANVEKWVDEAVEIRKKY